MVLRLAILVVALGATIVYTADWMGRYRAAGDKAGERLCVCVVIELFATIFVCLLFGL